MCPIWPLHIIILYLFPLLITYTAAKQWRSIEISGPSKLKLHMGSVATVNFTLYNVSASDFDPAALALEVSDPAVLTATFIDPAVSFHHKLTTSPHGVSEFKSQFDIRAQFLGYSDIRIKLKTVDETGSLDRTLAESKPLRVAVIRQERVIDSVFTASVAVLVSIIFVNFGCALDWPLLKSSLKVPVAPLIGFVSQFLFMPVISYGLARLLFPDSVPLQLGLFFTGVAPGGGASNVWIYALGGNINLSITMTAVSTFAAFVMIPFWSFTLGRLIFAEGSMVIPYRRIMGFAIALIIPLTIGYIIQRRLPRLSQVMVRILKPFSGCLIMFIILFAVYTNLYLFKLFTWKIVLAGAGLPWFGYLSGYILARLLRQPSADVLAISIETGIQNTGISIFMLRFSLGQPEADITTVVPVAVALMTPLPLLVYSVYHKYQARICPSELKQPVGEIPANTGEIVKFPVGKNDTDHGNFYRNGGRHIGQNGGVRNGGICVSTIGGLSGKRGMENGIHGMENGIRGMENGIHGMENGIHGMNGARPGEDLVL